MTIARKNLFCESSLDFGGSDSCYFQATGKYYFYTDGDDKIFSWTPGVGVSDLLPAGLYELGGIAASPSLLMAVGFNTSGGTGSLLLSTDGIAFSEADGVVGDDNLLDYQNGIFILGEGNGKFSVGTNGYDWISKNVGSGGYHSNCVWNGSKYCFLNADKFVKSFDGVNWSQTSTGIYFSMNPKIACNGDVIVGFSSGGAAGRSLNGGTTWASISPPYSGGWAELIAYGAGVFVAVASASIYSSADNGDTWTLRMYGGNARGPILGLRFQNGIFVATGGPGTFTSPNGINWSKE